MPLVYRRQTFWRGTATGGEPRRWVQRGLEELAERAGLLRLRTRCGGVLDWRLGPASTRRNAAVNRSIVPSGLSAGTSTASFVARRFVIRAASSQKPDDRNECGDEEHECNNTNQHPSGRREYSQMPPTTPWDGEIPLIYVASVRACVAGVALARGSFQHVCGNSEPVSAT